MKLKAAYSVTELSELSGLSRGQIVRLMLRQGIKISHVGSKRIVYLSSLKKALPDLWDSIVFRVSFD